MCIITDILPDFYKNTIDAVYSEHKRRVDVPKCTNKSIFYSYKYYFYYHVK